MQAPRSQAVPKTLGLSVALTVLALGLLATAWGQLWPSSSLKARLASGHALRVGYALEPPYAFLDADGTLRGESVDLLDALLADLGLRARSHVRLDFGSLLEELDAGRIDVIAGGMFITEERARRVRFTRPTAVVAAALLEHASADGEGRLAVLQGSVEAAHAQRLGYPAARVRELPDARTAMAALALGEVEAFALSAPSLRWLSAAADGGGDWRLRTQKDLPQGRPAFALRRSDAWLAEQMDAGLERLLGSERHLQLVAPYGFTREEVLAAARGGATE